MEKNEYYTSDRLTLKLVTFYIFVLLLLIFLAVTKNVSGPWCKKSVLQLTSKLSCHSTSTPKSSEAPPCSSCQGKQPPPAPLQEKPTLSAKDKKPSPPAAPSAIMQPSDKVTKSAT